MTVQTHLAALEEKHSALERRLQNVMSSPSSHDDEIVDIKRRKLQLKDEMERLQQN
ncbi:YdcH family protein [Martelella endophytica]|uniref:Coiled-coil domain-containing protein 149 n=1 Tax=Martelella endophytica TaxID=1486262 RepID=A0A0D5LUG9_MAREN|nr:DUF465 domain-containing protein [Martelella endophytica]AJY47869.1 coiled-coil domain-containing protein 149 [Martelella endophytica]